jgi:hypothetical protein
VNQCGITAARLRGGTMQRKLVPSIIFSLILSGAVSGCSDSPTALRSPSSSVSPDEIPQAVTTPERASLTALTRALAIALADPDLRQSLKEDMREAPFREHKLEVRKYIRENRGAKTRDAIARKAGRSGAALLSLLDSIRPLELYVPVRAQRESWDGNEPPLVLSQLGEDDEIVAFDVTGKAVHLSRTVPPSQVVIALIPVETHFENPMDQAKSKNVNDRGGKTIGTLERCSPGDGGCSAGGPGGLGLHKLVACDPDCGGGEVVDASYSGPGLYLEFSRLVDAKEPWFRGDPEVEVHIQGPTDTGNPQFGDDLSCSGEHAGDYRKVFDQNGNFWNGSVLLFSKEELDAYNGKFNEGFNVMFWEDDDTACTIKTDGNALKTLVEQTAKGAGGAAAVKVDGTLGYAIKAAVFLANLFSNANWLLTNDDFLGVAVDMRQLGETFPDATHDLRIGGDSNGRARLVYK